jgi:hypothetical protein
MSVPQSLTRRQFTSTVALSGLAGVNADKTEDDPAETSVDALAALLKARYGKHLTEAELKRLRPWLWNSLGSAEQIAKVKLTNSDEPAFIFTADVP